MDIQEFVSETLNQIIAGVGSAKEQSQGIAPDTTVKHGHDVPNNPLIANYGQDVINFVEFNIAVTVSDKSEGSAGGGLSVSGIVSAKGNKSRTSETMSENRIKFMVPVSYKRMSWKTKAQQSDAPDNMPSP